jgi:proteasome alpha subunit
MTVPFYVSPEQVAKDKADYARKGIAKGRSVIVMQYQDGIAFVAENPSKTLHKISEIYDRIAFAAVGKYNEFENLRVAGIRFADMRGFAYDRSDVNARSLANAYAQTLGSIFTEITKPYEVEVAVAQVGDTPSQDEIYRLTFDGSIADELGFLVMGGQSERLTSLLHDEWSQGLEISAALGLAARVLAEGSAEEREALTSDELEVAVLDRNRAGRKFKRINPAALGELLRSPVS